MKIDISKYGKKYTCFKCGCKFYDLRKPEPICPKCNANQKEMSETEFKIRPAKVSKKIDIHEEESEDLEEVASINEDDFPEIDDLSDDESLDLDDLEKEGV
jgi:hypothetical protein